jgi:hypothetical protein
MKRNTAYSHAHNRIRLVSVEYGSPGCSHPDIREFDGVFVFSFGEAIKGGKGALGTSRDGKPCRLFGSPRRSFLSILLSDLMM